MCLSTAFVLLVLNFFSGSFCSHFPIRVRANDIESYFAYALFFHVCFSCLCDVNLWFVV